MTIKHLLQGQPTLVQLDILHRSDVMFRNSVGRYYGGTLTTDQIEMLTPKPEVRHQRNS